MRMPNYRVIELALENETYSHYAWDSLVAKQCCIDDLDHDLIARCVVNATEINRMPKEAIGRPVKEILEKWDLIKGDDIRNAAMVLFAKSSHFYFHQYSIKMARFRGTEKSSDYIDNQSFQGNTFEIMYEIDLFLMRHLPIASFLNSNQFTRVDKPLLPVNAVREALCNALCHRDYLERNVSIHLAIFDDRLEIWNTGSLSSKLTIDKLKIKHNSYPRNRHISNVFYVSGQIENWGTGTTSMINACREHGIPDPIFEEYSGGFSITFMFDQPMGMQHELTCEGMSSFTSRQEEIINLFKKYSVMSIHELLEKLINPPSIRSVQRDLKELTDHGIIQNSGTPRHSLYKLNRDTD